MLRISRVLSQSSILSGLRLRTIVIVPVVAAMFGAANGSDSWSKRLEAAPTAGPQQAQATAERAAVVVGAPDSPVQLTAATILRATDGPPVVLYAAKNVTDQALDQFTLIAFVFESEGRLKAMQVAPGRRELNPLETKFSSMVLDGSSIAPTDVIVVGVNQAQRVNSEVWWRADLRDAAEATQRKRP